MFEDTFLRLGGKSLVDHLCRVPYLILPDRELLYGDSDVNPGRPTLPFVPDGGLEEVYENEMYDD